MFLSSIPANRHCSLFGSTTCNLIKIFHCIPVLYFHIGSTSMCFSNELLTNYIAKRRDKARLILDLKSSLSIYMKRSPLASPALLLRLVFGVVEEDGLLCQFLFLWLMNQLLICFNCKPVSCTNLALSSSVG